MIKMEFYNPSGNIDVTEPHAPRLDSLAGKRIALLSNDQWQAYRTLPLLKTLLKEDFANCDVLPPETFPQGITAIAREETATLLKDRGVDAVVIGNAA
ncbi:MAG: hypothetical protein K4571_07675 [Deltaproteobacteria bacterium]